MNLKDHIRSIKDYPKKGILFRDITTLIKNERWYGGSPLHDTYWFSYEYFIKTSVLSIRY